MPKKFVGENSKAVVARARKTAAKEVETSKKQKEIEDAYWEDNDKSLKKRQQKKEELEKKKQQLLIKKTEAKELLEKELENITKAPKQPQVKLTRAQIQAENEKRNNANQNVNKPVDKKVIPELPLEENVNRSLPEDIATTVDEAIVMLSDTSITPDKHPEKRMRAAYTAFEEKYMKKFKEENPTLRLSQLKQLLYKEWQKSSENPMCKFD